MPPRRQDRHNEMQGQTQENNQITGQKHDSAIPQHSQHEQEINSQGAQWQTQKKKQNRNQEQASSKTMWRPVSPQHKSSKESNQQEAAASGILSTIQIHNNYTNLEVQEPQNMNQAEKGATTGLLGPSTVNSHNTITLQNEQGTVTKSNIMAGIDSTIPAPKPLDILVISAEEESAGGMDGRVQEIHTNLQDGESKRGRELTHVLHEVVDRDHSSDSKAPATPTSTQEIIGQQVLQEENVQDDATGKQTTRLNNKSGGRLSKKKRDAIKKRQQKEQEYGTTDRGQQSREQVTNRIQKGRPLQDDYGALNSEDEIDPDNLSIDEYDEEEEEVSDHLIRAFGSTFNDECPAEVQEVTEQQGLSPRGRKQNRQVRQQATISTSATSSRPITRSKSKGF
ncbi:hypothetical protein R3W88_022612 [Solanum pinnatisectum]|uniref:Uncharacterized protein n=1 Tax=Solanum pinnatisectum TaxID=50273 RepID=A0AAV9LV29_9SOLN|nr:hypothetical protein R3W88_022612 [Solanum pinnatisectum]